MKVLVEVPQLLQEEPPPFCYLLHDLPIQMRVLRGSFRGPSGPSETCAAFFFPQLYKHFLPETTRIRQRQTSIKSKANINRDVARVQAVMKPVWKESDPGDDLEHGDVWTLAHPRLKTKATFRDDAFQPRAINTAINFIPIKILHKQIHNPPLRRDYVWYFSCVTLNFKRRTKKMSFNNGKMKRFKTLNEI